MVQDVYSKADVLNTTGSYGAPNFRQVKGSYPLYGMGQPSLNGFKQVLQRLQAQGHQVTVILFYICIFTGRILHTQAHIKCSCVDCLTNLQNLCPSLMLVPVHCSPAWPLSGRLVSKYLRSQVLSGGCG